MEMYSGTYHNLKENYPDCDLVKAMDAEWEARLALKKAMAAVMKAKAKTETVETNHYKACFDAARSAFGDKSFTAAELEKLVDHRISKNSVASMVAFSKAPESVKVWDNKENRRTERLLPSDLKDIGEYKKVEHYFLPCDASGKPIEGAEPVKMTSKGSKLYKFVD